MGACASKPKVLEGTAPYVAEEDITKNSKQEGIVGDDVPDKPHSLSNLFKESEEGKGSEQVKEETSETTQAHREVLPKTESPQASQTFLEKTTEEVIKPETKKRVEEIKSETETTPTQKKAKEEVVESETTAKIAEEEVIMSETAEKKAEEEVIKSETSEKKAEEEVTKSETESAEKTVVETVEIPEEEEVKKAEKKLEDNSETKSEAPVEEKTAKIPVIEERKSGKFWWDK